MKNIVLVAPGVHAPLTEGRKLFVMDLAKTLRMRGVSVEIISGRVDVGGMQAIRQSLVELREYCKTCKNVDSIAIFPYGTFVGSRRIANEWLLRQSLAIARRINVPALPVFYSCAGLRFEKMARKFAPSLAVGRSTAGVGAIHLGVSRKMECWKPSGSGLRNLLFLCGYQSPTRKALSDVLHQRGLLDLLHAGDRLASAGMRLSIAIPFLREPLMRDRLQRLAQRFCPTLQIDMHDSIDPASVFNGHDAFVFPYRAAHAVFIPTSLLEGILSGIPVIAADQVMYRSLTVGNDLFRCGLYRAGDPDDLVRQLLAMQEQYDSAVKQAEVGASAVSEKWNLERSADELIIAFSETAPARH